MHTYMCNQIRSFCILVFYDMMNTFSCDSIFCKNMILKWLNTILRPFFLIFVIFSDEPLELADVE